MPYIKQKRRKLIDSLVKQAKTLDEFIALLGGTRKPVRLLTSLEVLKISFVFIEV